MARTNLHLSCIALSVGLALSAQAQAQDQNSLSARRDAAASRLAADMGGEAQVSVHSATGSARFVRMAPNAGASAKARGMRPSGDAAKRNSSTQFLATYGNLFGISDAAAELDAGRIAKDRIGGTHITHKQVYQGVPVFGAELKTHFDASDNLTVVNGTFVPGISINPKPSRSADQAAATAMTRVKADLGDRALKVAKLSTTTPTLVVYRAGLAKGVEGANHLAWQMEVGNRLDVREFVFVDAHTGKVIDKINGIHEHKNRRAFDGLGVNPAPGPNYPASPFWVEGQGFPTGTAEADNMIAASGEIYDLFKNAFGRDSFNGNGATMDSIFNRGNGCPNASWNGSFISFCPGTTTDDVTAHEWGHAYTEYTHGLIYAWQPGALNEAYSDIWGETVDRINERGGDTPDAVRTAGSCTASTPAAPSVVIASPPAIAGSKEAGGASFGPLTFNVTTNNVVYVNDGSIVGTTPTNGSVNDGCTSPFVNAAAVSGKIALIDRGTCGFAVKVKNAQDNGAIGVIVADNSGGDTVAGMGGADATITIPSLRISQNNGTAIKAQLTLGAVTASIARGGFGTDSSVRWLMGEDSSAFGGAIRDMYNPVCYGNPGKVSDKQYSCGPNTQAGDNGGVHSNSGVPNHAYALLVDGGTYNGQNVFAIGLTKAAHIYYRAQSVYQGPASGFADHADAIKQSCLDLTGVNLNHLKTGAPSGEVINASDCAQIDKAMLAVEMRTPPAQCNFAPILAQSPPAQCDVGSPTVLASDSFNGGKTKGIRWVATNGGTGDFAPRNWGVVNGLPGSRAGYAILAGDPNIGNCGAGSDATSLQRLESPEITIPAGTPVTRMSFDHYVATESEFDGGNVKISVNGAAWQLVKKADFVFNGYNTTMATAGAGNSSPLAGEPGFSGTDGGTVGTGSWGRSIVNLSAYAVPGDKIKLRFEMGTDGCGGIKGWFVDDVSVYRCSAP